MSQFILVSGEDDPYDALNVGVSTLVQFYAGLRAAPSVLPIAFGDADTRPCWAGLWQDTLPLPQGIIFAVPSSPLQHVYTDVVQRVLMVQPAGVSAWIVHTAAALETALALEAVLHSRRTNLYPRFHWRPECDRATTHLEALRFMNFCFTRSSHR